MSPELSPETQRRVDMMYPPEQREEVVRLLVDECGHNLPFTSGDPAAYERVRSALKVSNGDGDSPEEGHQNSTRRLARSSLRRRFCLEYLQA